MYKQDNNLVEAQVKISEVSFNTKFNLLTMVKKSSILFNRKHNFVDENGVSYSVSREMGVCSDKLVVSVVDHGDNPNASILPFLEMNFGMTEKRIAKPWLLDNSKTIFTMTWHFPNLDYFRPNFGR